MARLARSKAGAQVVALAHELSDALLSREEALFAVHRSLFVDKAPRAAVDAGVGRANGDVEALTHDKVMLAAVKGAHRNVTLQAVTLATALFSDSANLSLGSIRKELTLCERTLGGAYKGLADEACDMVEPLVDDLVEQARSLHKDNATAADKMFVKELGKQMLAARADPDVEKVTARILSPTPVRGKGIGGRGVWHRTTSDLDASARSGCIGIMNSTRRLAMAQFNEAGRGR